MSFSKMDPEVKAKWVAALRSGNFKQGKNALALRRRGRKTQHCCLGVLCEVQGVKRARSSVLALGKVTYSYFGHEAYLPPEVANAVRLREGAQHALAGMNDGRKSFEEIANWIEQNL